MFVMGCLLRDVCYERVTTVLDLYNNINKNKYIQKDKYACLWIWTVFGLIV